MEIEQTAKEQEYERQFLDFLDSRPAENNKTFTLNLDDIRRKSKPTSNDIVKNPSKYYRLIKAYLEKHQQN